MAKAKLQITMDEDLLKDVDQYCDDNFMNRSWLISQSLVQFLNQYKLINAIQDLSLAMRKIADEGSIDNEQMKQLEDMERLCKMFVSAK